MLEEICLKERKVSKNKKGGHELEGWHQGIYIYNYAPVCQTTPLGNRNMKSCVKLKHVTGYLGAV